MNLTLIRTALVAAVMAVTLALTGCSTGDEMAGMPSEHRGMTPGGSASAAGEFNDGDVMFVQMMIPHHEQAVDMSDMVLSKTGVHPDVTALAQQIKAAQQPEIDQMNSWLTAWGRQPMDHGGGHDSGGGLMSEDEMQELDQADGPDAQRLFLEGMIRHHQGAIAMAKTEMAGGKNPAAVQLAENIAESQQQEIDAMTALLSTI